MQCQTQLVAKVLAEIVQEPPGRAANTALCTSVLHEHALDQRFAVLPDVMM